MVTIVVNIPTNIQLRIFWIFSLYLSCFIRKSPLNRIPSKITFKISWHIMVNWKPLSEVIFLDKQKYPKTKSTTTIKDIYNFEYKYKDTQRNPTIKTLIM